MDLHRVLFAGSFDPFTIGHADIVNRGLKLFDEVVIAVSKNSEKESRGSVIDRVNAIQAIYNNNDRIHVVENKTLTVTCAKRHGCCAILRGARTAADWDYEQNLAYANKSLNPKIDTIILPASPDLTHVSSSLVRELESYNMTQEAAALKV